MHQPLAYCMKHSGIRSNAYEELGPGPTVAASLPIHINGDKLTVKQALNAILQNSTE